MDGVIFDLMSGFINIYNNGLYIHLQKKLEDVNCWEFYKEWGLSREECFEIFDKIDQRELSLLDPNIPSYLKEMNNLHDVDIVTLKPFENEPIIKEALSKNGIIEGVHYNNLVIKSYDVPDVKFSLDYDVYIDDSEKLGKKFEDNNTDKILVLYDSPWNQTVKSNKVVRVKGWKEVMKVMRVLSCS